MQIIEAQVISVIFTNERNGFTVARIKTGNLNEVATGSFPLVRAGERVRLRGDWIEHSKYGKQFSVQSAEVLAPQGSDGLIAYLGSGVFSGIGEKTATKLVDAFGEDLPRILDMEPARLNGAVRGLSGKRLEKFIDDWYLQSESRKTLLFLYKLGFTGPKAIEVWNAYKSNAENVVRENPYILCRAPFLWSFEVADNAAKKLEFNEYAEARLQAAVLKTLQDAKYGDGHAFLPYEILLQNTLNFLRVNPHSLDDEIYENIYKCINDLSRPTESRNRQIIVQNCEDGTGGGCRIWLPELYEAERFIGAFIRKRLNAGASEFLHSDAAVRDAASELGISYSKEQVAAIKEAVSHKIFVITGGPGTGKTTILRGILHILKERKKKFHLAAPTGRAARRMAELCGERAFTIHRLLEIDPMSGSFCRNENNPLETNCVVIDESSMIDDELAADLMHALPQNSTLILIGDSDQLPSVGAGNVLREILSVPEVPSARLSRIYRQGESSDIAENAHIILAGHKPNLRDGSHFHYIQYQNSNEALKIITELAQASRQIGENSELQILTPMHKGALGTKQLNEFLQKALNFDSPGFEFKGTRWSVGDPVMQLKNNYEKDIFNGDLGRITRIMPMQKKIEVDFENRSVTLADDDFNELTLAYACTVHKSQGSEYKKVIVILDYSHSIMLQRNLLYTAVTRAKENIWILASPNSLETAIRNNRQKLRFTGLAGFI